MMAEQVQTRKAQIHKRLIEVRSDTDEQEEKRLEYEDALKKVSDEIQRYTAKTGECEEKINELQQQLSKQNEQLRIGQTAYHREQSRLESLKNITERYDGYGNSIRKVMMQKDTVPGLLGVVADIIKVDKEYEIAVETALGGSIQNIVTSDEQTAKNDRVSETEQIRPCNLPSSYKYERQPEFPAGRGSAGTGSDWSGGYARTGRG